MAVDIGIDLGTGKCSCIRERKRGCFKRTICSSV